MEAYQFISGHEKVIDHFGQWPSFHDGEVHRFVLDRTEKVGRSYVPTIELHLRGWILTGKVKEDGYLETEGDAVVRFKFEEVYDVEVDGFNHQNVLGSLVLSLIGSAENSEQDLLVQLVHCFGLSGEFKAKRARVLGIEAWTESVDG
jgi:hypothetical protein